MEKVELKIVGVIAECPNCKVDVLHNSKKYEYVIKCGDCKTEFQIEKPSEWVKLSDRVPMEIDGKYKIRLTYETNYFRLLEHKENFKNDDIEWQKIDLPEGE